MCGLSQQRPTRSQQSLIKNLCYCIVFKVLCAYGLTLDASFLSLWWDMGKHASKSKCHMKPEQKHLERFAGHKSRVHELSLYIWDTRLTRQTWPFRRLCRDHHNGLINLENQSKFQGTTKPFSCRVTPTTGKTTKVVTCWRRGTPGKCKWPRVEYTEIGFPELSFLYARWIWASAQMMAFRPLVPSSKSKLLLTPSVPYELWTKVCCSWNPRLSSPHPQWVLVSFADERQPCGVRALKQREMPEQCKTYRNYGEAEGRERIRSKSITGKSQTVNKNTKTTIVPYRLIVLKSLTGPLLTEEDACTHSLLLSVSSSHSQLLWVDQKTNNKTKTMQVFCSVYSTRKPVFWRSAWSTQQIPGQPRLHRETQSQTNKQANKILKRK